ncbi:unnamed protein product [Euphydryas editha]|uniref:Endonuclease/exonuclease/phosphatase domain-containing protein n=1 Tax=Euphydryas editha TaxID=104508 RepID=A0AAU9UGG4_EUPED|nr:unnamed protein product [Euphydryas editha]
MQTVRELNPDLVLISEPYKHLSTQPWETDSTTKAVIWACGGCTFQSSANNNEAGFVVAKLEGIYFYSCYALPSLTLDEFKNLVDHLTEDAKQYTPIAIAGDFNAWAVDWGSKETNARGKILLESMSSLDVVLLNSGDKPTFVRGEANSIVDLTFVSSSLVKGKCSWKVMDTYTASDHCALLWEVSSEKCTERMHRKSKTTGWKIGAFDPEVFMVALNSEPISDGNAEHMAKYLMKRITEACDTAMPRKRAMIRHSSMHWWNENISNLRIKCLKARRAAQRRRKKPNYEELVAVYKKTRQSLNKAIKDSKRRCWNELILEVEDDPWGRPYKAVMTHLKNQPMPSPTCPKLLDKIVATLFPHQMQLHRQIEQYETEEIPPITEDQLFEACSRVGNTKAPGLDGIPNIALKAAIKAAPAIFLDVYNNCLTEGTFPSMWKQQRLVLLPKGKKPPEEPTSYRPLCMLDTAGCSFVRGILRNRLLDDLYIAKEISLPNFKSNALWFQ